MASEPTHSLDRLLEDALAGAPPGPCPDENVLAGLADGTLAEGERTVVLEHVLRCSPCREVAQALAGSPQAAQATARRWRPVLWVGAAAAAVVLLGIGLWARGSGTPSPGSVTTAAALEAATVTLARAHPAEFGDFRMLTAEELRVPAPEPLRGDAAGAAPSGRILDTRPSLRWSPVPGARAYVVTLLGPEGVRWKRTTSATTLAWPDDAPGLEPGARFVWTLTADDPHATEVERAFHVLSAEEALRWRAAVTAAETVGTPLRWLLLAHAALRRDLPAEAADHAARFLAARPGEPLATATLAAARARASAR